MEAYYPYAIKNQREARKILPNGGILKVRKPLGALDARAGFLWHKIAGVANTQSSSLRWRTLIAGDMDKLRRNADAAHLLSGLTTGWGGVGWFGRIGDGTMVSYAEVSH